MCSGYIGRNHIISHVYLFLFCQAMKCPEWISAHMEVTFKLYHTQINLYLSKDGPQGR